MKNHINSIIDNLKAEKSNIYTVFAVTLIVIMAINGFFFMGLSLGHDSWDIAVFEKELYGRVRITQGRFLTHFVNDFVLNGLNLPWLIGIFEYS